MEPRRAAQTATQGQQSPKPVAGGYVRVRVAPLMMCWYCYQEGLITLRQLRVWLALHEVAARRFAMKGERKPKFGPNELQKLVGGVGGAHLRADVAALRAVGLADVGAHHVKFAKSPEDLNIPCTEQVQELIDTVENRKRSVPIPRRMLRYLAACSKKALIATAIGHLLRLVYLRRREVGGYGRCKASWISERFGVDVRSVKRSRKLLIAIGVLTVLHPSPSSRERFCENRWGKALDWNLTWESASSSGSETAADCVETASDQPPAVAESNTGLSPQSRFSTTRMSPPRRDTDPLREDLKNPELASSRESGVQEELPSRGAKPTIHDVKIIDLSDPGRLVGLWHSAAQMGFIGRSEADKLRFAAIAERALRYGDSPPKMFRWLLGNRKFEFITQDMEDAARRKLRDFEFGSPLGAKIAPSKPRRSFVTDAPAHVKLPESFTSKPKAEWVRSVLGGGGGGCVDAC